MTVIETPRLVMRPFEVADVEQAFLWFGDPQVMRYTPTGPDASIERTGERLARYREHGRPGALIRRGSAAVAAPSVARGKVTAGSV